MMKTAHSSTDTATNISTAKSVFVCAHCGGSTHPRVQCVRKTYNGQDWLLCLSCHEAFQKLCNDIAGKAKSFYLVRTARRNFRRLAAS
jgi:transcription elongation factor Elf1